MTDIHGVERSLGDRLPALLNEHGVPGAAIAIGHGAEQVNVAAGVVNLGTGAPVLTNSLFQIGSVTKAWTATLVMQVITEGRMGLDDRVRRHLPEFRLADENAAASVTIRQLLSHTSGFEGDVFTDTGRGDDCLARYVDQLADVPQIFAPGQMFSYNNAAYCLLGRLLEVLENAPYDEILRERLLAPLGLRHVARDADEAVLHSTAVGHLPTGPGGALEPTKVWAMARSNAPAGSMLAMSAADLLIFARAHLEGDAQILPPATAGLMREQQVVQPDLLQGTGWGLGWEHFYPPGASIFGHDGNTIGQSAYLRILPDDGVTFALLANGGNSRALFEAIFEQVCADLARLTLPERPIPTQGMQPRHPERYCGHYRSASAETAVFIDECGRLQLDRVPIGQTATLDEPFRAELVAWRGDSLLPLAPVAGVCAPVAFLGDDGSGRARYLHTGRAEPRIPDDASETSP